VSPDGGIPLDYDRLVQHYLSICAIYCDEAPTMREWIEFHRLVGVERFFMYNNESTDDHLEVLAPYLEDGTVVLHEWPMRPGQMAAYDHCLQTHGDESRWIAFIDLDEFLFSPTLQPLPDLLAGYQHHPGVVVNWVMFGTSGHVTRAPGLVIESHDHRKRHGPDGWESLKSIVDPTRVERVLSPHAFLYRDGLAVNERHIPKEPPLGLSRPASVERFRINHYAHRSVQEYRAKLARPQAHSGTYKEIPEHTLERRMRRLNEVRDDTIKAYLPALREALGRFGDTPLELQAR
jgi:glycosyl transferase family 92